MLRGLALPWKKTVYYQFDENMDKIKLLNHIEVMTKNNFHLKGFVCDMGNQTLVSEVGIRELNNSIHNKNRILGIFTSSSNNVHMFGKSEYHINCQVNRKKMIVPLYFVCVLW